MDCTNEHFTINCESNPALYRKCSVQWMEGWSDSSMKKVNRETVSVLSFEPHLYLLIHFGHVTHFFLDPRDAAVKDGRRG